MILDWEKYLSKAAETAAEGIVMLKNDNNALPLDMEKEISVFGRIQLHYYKSGTGSGGMVNVSKVTGVIEGLEESGVKLDQDLLDIYKKWDQENPFDAGEGWGNEPWSQKEMPLDVETVRKSAGKNDTAIVVIGRTAGEEQDNKTEEGAYLLSTDEKEMLRKVRAEFKKVVVLLNVGGLIDLDFIESCSPDAILYIWQGGMTGGTGTADVLTGKVSPSGKLPDTIAYDITDYSSDKNFGSIKQNLYQEDIYVGYRYFETFCRDKVRYPFGFGLSYTSFSIGSARLECEGRNYTVKTSVKNTGNYTGKEVVQIYCEAPQGKLGKPLRSLCGFVKTPLLAPGEECDVTVSFSMYDISSYDDSGVTGHKNCYVLEAGKYRFYCGNDVRKAELFSELEIQALRVTDEYSENMAPVTPFKRMIPLAGNEGTYTVDYQDVPLQTISEEEKRKADIPEEIDYTGDKGIKLADVREGRKSMKEFIAQLDDHDLSCIIRGEGMSSPKVTLGTASAFGGVSEKLQYFGIPCCCCDDGPSGMRLDCGTKAFSLPNGTMIASTFNPDLVAELFEFTGTEMRGNNVDVLLGPGMNIHRHPLNGRNFEYFSEDPLLTGKMAVAVLKGLKKGGSGGTIKHFCGNNQETNRFGTDSVMSQRAAREIYLKGFEIAVKSGYADSVMTTYGPVNGLWTAGNYDLSTAILRDEWGFKGIVMTDWWADINERGTDRNKTNFAAMIRSQNDLYMVCADGASNNDNTLESLENGTLTRAELQRSASNICSYIMNTYAMDRLMGKAEKIEIINCPDADDRITGPVENYTIENESLDVPVENISAAKESSFTFSVTVNNPGFYNVSITASSELSDLAQIPVTLYNTGSVCGLYVWSGTGGEPVKITKRIALFSRFNAVRLYFAQNGLKIHSVRFELAEKIENPHILLLQE